MKVLGTGLAGFIGSHVLEALLRDTDWDVTAIDSFRHKGKTSRISDVLAMDPGWRPRVQVITHDLCAPFDAQLISRIGPVDHVIAMASESHVPRSIADPVRFCRNNTDIALSTLEYARQVHPQSVLWISTDEVYGPQAPGAPPHREWAPVIPSSPYAASKAAQEALCISWHRTYDVPVAIVNAANLIGERQDPEKFLPLVLRKVLAGDTVEIHSQDGEPGSRYYLHAANLADALVHIITRLPPARFRDGAQRPDRYNVIAADRISNLELAQRVAALAGVPLHYQMVPFDRPGHDAHYGLDGIKLAMTGWKPPVGLDEALERIVGWYLDHREWLAAA